MKRKLFILALFCAGLFLPALAQTTHNPAALEKGAYLPDLQLTGLLHYPTPTAPIKAIQSDKLLIIHFWATWCPVCQATMPRINALQQQYKDRVQVLMVTYEDQAVVAA